MLESHKQAIANFTSDFEAAIVGLQMNNPDMPTITASQYACMLASGIYAAQMMQERKESMPDADTEANFDGFLNHAAEHYAETLANVAIQHARDVLEQAGLPSLELPVEP